MNIAIFVVGFILTLVGIGNASLGMNNPVVFLMMICFPILLGICCILIFDHLKRHEIRIKFDRYAVIFVISVFMFQIAMYDLKELDFRSIGNFSLMIPWVIIPMVVSWLLFFFYGGIILQGTIQKSVIFDHSQK